MYPGVVSALGFVEWRNHDRRGQLEGSRSAFAAIVLARASGAYAVAIVDSRKLDITDLSKARVWRRSGIPREAPRRNG